MRVIENEAENKKVVTEAYLENIYDGVFLQNLLTAKIHELFSQKSTISYVWQSRKHVSVLLAKLT